MELIIDLKTGHGRVKEMRDGVLHSTGFAAGDVAQAEKLGITSHTDKVWTTKMKSDFAALVAKEKLDAKKEATARTVKKAKDEADREAAIQTRVDAAVDAKLAER